MKFVFLKGFLLGIVGMALLYYLLLFALSGNPRHPFSQFILFQPWMSVLIIGFGIQFGLFWLLRKGYVATGASTAVSGMAMVACCAHHALDVLPILGVSAAAVFLSEYQQQFLQLGVVINTIGIGMLLLKVRTMR